MPIIISLFPSSTLETLLSEIASPRKLGARSGIRFRRPTNWFMGAAAAAGPGA